MQGLLVSRGIGDSEPAVFNEPGLFLIAADGSVYCESILSMPVGRPRTDDLLAGIDYWIGNDDPAAPDDPADGQRDERRASEVLSRSVIPVPPDCI